MRQCRSKAGFINRLFPLDPRYGDYLIPAMKRVEDAIYTTCITLAFAALLTVLVIVTENISW